MRTTAQAAGGLLENLVSIVFARVRLRIACVGLRASNPAGALRGSHRLSMEAGHRIAHRTQSCVDVLDSWMHLESHMQGRNQPQRTQQLDSSTRTKILQTNMRILHTKLQIFEYMEGGITSGLCWLVSTQFVTDQHVPSLDDFSMHLCRVCKFMS